MKGEQMECWTGTGSKGDLHNPADIGADGYPRHAPPVQLHICFDSRRDHCPYALSFDVHTEYISFAQTFCLYGIRKKPQA